MLALQKANKHIKKDEKHEGKVKPVMGTYF